MKQVNLILQSKGGVGKSLFMWFIAQQHKKQKTFFIDLDESTQTSSARLGAVVGKDRVKAFKILNEYKKLEREKIIGIFEGLANAKSETFYIDFGAPESAEFLSLLLHDVPADILREELVSLGITLRVFVVVAGRDALTSCVNYYNDLSKAIGKAFPLTMVVNMGTFGGIETAEIAIGKLVELGYDPIKRFGDLGSGSALKEIIDLIGQPDPDPATLGLMSRIMYRKKQEEITDIIA